MPRQSSIVHPETEHWSIETAALSNLASLCDLAQNTGKNSTPESFRTLIAARHIVCANQHGTVTGFYAVNVIPALYPPEPFPDVRAAFNVLCNRLKLSDRFVGFGTLSAIKPASGGSHLRLHLLRALLRQVGLRYRYLFTSVQKDDGAELSYLAEEGWRCFHEEDHTSYMMLHVAKALRSLASRLLLPGR
jgi:hypothetical protein